MFWIEYNYIVHLTFGYESSQSGEVWMKRESQYLLRVHYMLIMMPNLYIFYLSHLMVIKVLEDRYYYFYLIIRKTESQRIQQLSQSHRDSNWAVVCICCFCQFCICPTFYNHNPVFFRRLWLPTINSSDTWALDRADCHPSQFRGCIYEFQHGQIA